LSKNPGVEAKLHAELAQKLSGRTPALDDLLNLTYTRMVLDDALRLYSPVPLLARDAAVDDELAGYHVPKGTMVVVMPYATHRHPDFWEKSGFRVIREPDVLFPDGCLIGLCRL
jgi:cytochrome P450